MLESVQTAIPESGFPLKYSSDIGRITLQSSPIASPIKFRVYHA